MYASYVCYEAAQRAEDALNKIPESKLTPELKEALMACRGAVVVDAQIHSDFHDDIGIDHIMQASKELDAAGVNPESQEWDEKFIARINELCFPNKNYNIAV